VPLPSKITIQVVPPIDLKERLGSKPDLEKGYRVVTATMQSTLDRLAEKRTLPVVG
jgi:hypothetical protein